MRTNLNAALLITGLAGLFLISCKKDPKKNDPTYVVTKGTYLDGYGSVNNTANYTYNGNKISRIDVSGMGGNFYYTFEYSGERIVKRNEFLATSSNTPFAYDTVSYNSDGSIRSIEHYTKIVTPDFEKDMVKEFTYTDKHLTRVILSEIKSSSTLSAETEYDFIYTNGNATSVKIIDLTTTQHGEERLAFAYDNHPNYYSKLYLQPYLTDFFFGYIDPSFVLFTESANNVSGFGTDGYVSVPVTYTLDEHQNPIEIKFGEQVVARYEIKEL